MSFFVSAGLMIGQSGIEALRPLRRGEAAGDVPGPGRHDVPHDDRFRRALARVGRGRACIVVPIAIAALAVAGRVGLAAEPRWITQTLWLLQGAGYFLLGLACGASPAWSRTHGRRTVLPLIGAGGVLGYVLGGLSTKPLAAALGTPDLLFVWAATLVVAAFLGGRLAGHEAAPGGRRRSAEAADGPIEQLRLGFRYGALLAHAMARAGVGAVLAAVLLAVPAVLPRSD